MKQTQLLITTVPNSPHSLANVAAWTKRGEIIDAGCFKLWVYWTLSYKILHSAEKWLPI